jgi:hypothetical protein
VGNRRRHYMHPTFYRRRVDPNNLGSQDHSFMKERRNEQVTIALTRPQIKCVIRLPLSGLQRLTVREQL